MPCRSLLLTAIWLSAWASALSAAQPAADQPPAHQPLVTWDEIAPLPDPEGFAGMYAGVHGKVLIAVGGANFPSGRPWEDGEKVWYDKIFVLERPGGQWKTATATLPRPLAYGVSISCKHGLLCIGGGDATEHVTDVRLLAWDGNDVTITSLAPLPAPCAQMCGTLVDGSVYVAGGIDKPDATKATKNFWQLDITDDDPSQWKWTSLEPWDGPARHQAVAASQGGAFYLIGGVDRQESAEGKPERVLPLLRDVYCFKPSPTNSASGKWKKLADVPVAAVAAPSPAPAMGEGHILVLPGLDDSLSRAAVDANHQGFGHQMFAYHTVTDTWVAAGNVPDGSSRVTAPVATLTGADNEKTWLVVSGEKAPGIRSPQVHRATTLKLSPSFGTLNWTVLCCYLGALLTAGAYFSRREHSTDDFFLGGQRIPWWAAGISIFGTQLSAITFLAIPANVFSGDWTVAIATLMIIVIAPVVIIFFLPFFRRLNVVSAYEYLEHRFSVVARMYGSLAFMVLHAGRMGIVLYLPAIALSAVTGINIYWCIFIMGIFCTAYTVLGGIEAVIWTDVLQVAVLMGGALFCLTVIGAGVDGGLGGVFSAGHQAGKLRLVQLNWDYTQPVLWLMVLGGFFHSLIPYTSDQTVVQRYLTTRDEKTAARGIWINAALTLPAIAIFFTAGTALWAFYRQHPDLAPVGKTNEVFAFFIANELAPGIAGLLISGVFAASMSSMDSSMNSIATAYTTDFHRRLFPDLSDARQLTLARQITVLLGMIGTVTAAFLAFADVGDLWMFFVKIVGMLGGGLCGLFILGIFTERASENGVLLGAAAGFAAPLAIYFNTTPNPFLYPFASVVTTVVVGYLASLVLPGAARGHQGLTIYSLGKKPFESIVAEAGTAPAE